MKRVLVAAVALAAAPFAATADDRSVDVNVKANMPTVCLIADKDAPINNLTAFDGDIEIDMGSLSDGEFDGESNAGSWVSAWGQLNNTSIRVFCNAAADLTVAPESGEDFLLTSVEYAGVTPDDGFVTEIEYYVAFRNTDTGAEGGSGPAQLFRSSGELSQNGWDATIQPRVGVDSSEKVKAMEGDYVSTFVISILPDADD